MPPRPRRRPPPPDPDDDEDLPALDLHGLRPEEALRRLEQALHAARVRGTPELVVVTGRGLRNATGRPVLRERVAAWLRGPEGRARGVRSVRVTSKGGALTIGLG